jgi:ribosomal protein S18 acetylase RimI-like enzyme
MRPPSRQRLTPVDWSTLPRERLTPLYAAETTRWASTLEWDTAGMWEEVERGRSLGTVGGVVVLDERGVPAGWSYYLLHNGALQIGGFVAASDAAAQPMLDWIMSRPEHASADRISLFAFADAPGLPQMLRGKGLSVDRYWYLGRDLQRQAPPRLADARPWRPDDAMATAELMARAYDARDEARPFAPAGGLSAWVEYVEQLTTGIGCGRLLPEACVAVPGGPNRLLAVALVTRIGATTAHLAQIVVEPQLQGRRVGVQLLEAACAAAGQTGAERITLLVGGKNARARRLYEAARFESMGTFVSAGTLQPRRSTSVAPGSAAMARR